MEDTRDVHDPYAKTFHTRAQELAAQTRPISEEIGDRLEQVVRTCARADALLSRWADPKGVAASASVIRQTGGERDRGRFQVKNEELLAVPE